MKISIKDKMMINCLQPKNISGYLKSQHWQEMSDTYNQYKVFTLNNEEIIVPHDYTLADYPVRVSEILQSLEILENRSQLDIYMDILHSLSDIIKIRIDNQEIINGSIPIYDAVNFFDSVKKLMYSAASSINSYKSFYQGISGDTKDFMNLLRFGQTEPGSFIVNIIIPLEEVNQSRTNTSDLSIDFKRSVSEKLFNSIIFINDNNISDESIFDAAIENGVSANLCQAIISIFTFVNNDGIEFARKSSFLAKKNHEIPDKVIIKENKIDDITIASNKLKKYTYKGILFKQETIQDLRENLGHLHRIKGQVVGIEWNGINTDYKINLISENGEKYVVVLNSKRDYKKAMNAHINQLPISFLGELDSSLDPITLNYSQII